MIKMNRVVDLMLYYKFKSNISNKMLVTLNSLIWLEMKEEMTLEMQIKKPELTELKLTSLY